MIVFCFELSPFENLLFFRADIEGVEGVRLRLVAAFSVDGLSSFSFSFSTVGKFTRDFRFFRDKLCLKDPTFGVPFFGFPSSSPHSLSLPRSRFSSKLASAPEPVCRIYGVED